MSKLTKILCPSKPSTTRHLLFLAMIHVRVFFSDVITLTLNVASQPLLPSNKISAHLTTRAYPYFT